MSLEYAILGFLNYMPYSGYDLKKAFDASVRHFWPADQSQIYRTLNQLVKHGWAKVEVIEQIGRPDRKVYHITPAGREALRDWLAGPLPAAEERIAALIQVFFAGQLSDDEILAKFEGLVAHLRELLDIYRHVPEQIQDYVKAVGSSREEYFWLLTLQFGINSTQAHLIWAEGVIQQIRNKQVPPT
jgi:DNA-binding PadR family transcriptional regulator